MSEIWQSNSGAPAGLYCSKQNAETYSFLFGNDRACLIGGLYNVSLEHERDVSQVLDKLFEASKRYDASLDWDTIEVFIGLPEKTFFLTSGRFSGPEDHILQHIRQYVQEMQTARK